MLKTSPAMLVLFYVVSFIVLNQVYCVPPSTTGRVLPSSSHEDVVSEVATIRNTMKVLSEQWEKWNTLFITSLEPRITSTASTLSTIDSNIHNLQERTHVWDTFQLHVAAWNDQLASLDSKIDILSKGMEKLIVIDSKLSTMLQSEYKLDRLTKIVNTLEESLLDLGSSVKNKYKPSKDSLFEEFAARGILSSLKLVERKLDRLLIGKQNDLMRLKTLEDSNTKCNLPKQTEELLNDISSKVDVIFDGINKKFDPDYTDDYTDGKYHEGSGNPDSSTSLEQNITSKKPSFVTHRKPLEEIFSKILEIDRNTYSLQKDISNINYNLQNVCNKTVLEQTFRTVFENYRDDQNQYINSLLNSYFREQRTYEKSMFARLNQSVCNVKNKEIVPLYPSSTERIREQIVPVTTETVLKPPTIKLNVKNDLNYVTNQNKTSCDHLDIDNNTSGIYVFKNNFADFRNERFFNKKFCLVRDDGLWTVIQRRNNYTLQQDFNVSWNDYKLGFGDLERDFWIGNNFLARWSKNNDLTLRIELEDFDGNYAWAEYTRFQVLDEEEEYKLVIGGYSGNSSDALLSHDGALFSTFDRKNDQAPDCCPCSVSYGGGWWFTSCFESNLNGLYYRKPYVNDYFRGIIWEHWLGNYSLKKSVMMVKSNGYTQLYHPNRTRVEEP
ncbi:angiopoietin-related protein 3-like [Sitophilus oryzae]|uniref:Angiopoietin-related protein 3-like n=1 Tax=Sitophilus oryzae TaxID=7048 RepID=A0A6J2Y4C2_SITOR|nr:angiopoietin-related protein 3-like [Sitophilus oryzae]